MNLRFFVSLFALMFSTVGGAHESSLLKTSKVNNNCITFSVSQGTGCAWMCNYCATKLGTNNYYFTDNVCTYMEGYGCVGSPYAGVSYTCCSTSVE